MVNLGYGNNTLTIEIAHFTRHVIKIDFNPNTLAITRQHIDRLNLQNVTLLTKNVNELPLDSNSVNITFFSQSLHHLNNPKNRFRKTFHILHPGGYVFMMELTTHHEQ